MTEPQKTDAELMSELPLLVRDIVERSNWKNQLRKIVTERHLRVDQGAFLETAVLKFITGDQSAEEMAVGITNEIKLDPENLKSLFEQLDREIFTPMKNDLEKSLADGNDLEANPPSGSADKSSSPAENDDLEAMINAGDDLMSTQPKPVVSVAPPSVPPPSPVKPVVPVPPVISRSASDAVLAADPLASARAKLALPVVRPAEVSSAMLSKPTAGATSTPATTTPPDPYREPAH